jgi:hypothetical protein
VDASKKEDIIFKYPQNRTDSEAQYELVS